MSLVAIWGHRIDDFLRPLWTKWNERQLNIQTVDPDLRPGSERSRWKGELTDKAKHHDNHAYASPDYWYVRKILKRLALGPEDVLFDLGAGMGRIVCLAASSRVRKCVGVELFEPLCEIAKRNAASVRGRRAPIEIICGDCASVDLGGGTVYFLFNPFGVETMNEVLNQIHRSILAEPRRVQIVYYNAVHEDLFKSCGWLTKAYEFYTLSQLRVSFWENRGKEN